jgi:ATP-dependent DNA helicase PIF1
VDTFKDISEEYVTEFHNCLSPLEGLGLICYLVGSPVMLLRNLDAPRLCSGRVFQVKTLLTLVTEATIYIDDAFIPKMPIIPSDIQFKFADPSGRAV